jgi:hypothetical protein
MRAQPIKIDFHVEMSSGMILLACMSPSVQSNERALC